MELMANFWALFVTAAPWLLLGFFVAGLIHAFVPTEFMHKQLGDNRVTTTIKAAFIGAPLPLCSCGVIPAALGLRRSGASKRATVSFLVATPETGVDSVSVSYAMLGPIMALIRPIAAISSAIVAGLLVRPNDDNNTHLQSETEVSSCCSKSEPVETVAESSCCSQQPSPPTIVEKFKDCLRFSTGKLVSDTAKWLVLGLFFAALIETFVSHDFLASHGQGILAMTVMVLVSIPMYICATASTPIAAGLLFAGVSPGSILVFMLAGPATNIATLGVVGKEMGRQALIAYLVGVIGTAMIFGGLLDMYLNYFNIDIRDGLQQHAHFVPEAVSQIAAIVLALLLLRVGLNKVKDSMKPNLATEDSEAVHPRS